MKYGTYWQNAETIDRMMINQLKELEVKMPPEIIAGGYLRAACFVLERLENPKQWEIIKSELLNFEEHIDYVGSHCDNLIDVDRAAMLFDNSYLCPK